MARHRSLNRLPRRITGASAIEFALVFPMLFMIVYGTLTYGYVYFLQQRINFIAQEAVRAAISVAPTGTLATYCSAVTAQANLAILQNFTIGGDTLPSAVEPLITCLTDPITNVLSATVRLSYRLAATSTEPALLPTVVLPGIGPIPPLPAMLIATATGRLS